jgi:TolA-binding protein
MATMDCKRVTAEDVAEHYLFGRLADADRDAFESHVFECDRCFDDLRTLQAVQAELQSMPPTAALAAARRGWFPVWVAAAAAVALAAALGLWAFGDASTRIGDRTGQEASSAGRSQPAASDRPDAVAARVAELTRVEPPPYIPLTVRSADDWRARFDAAMAAYAMGRYAEAAEGLEIVASRQPAAANVRFFLGISYLMLDRTDDAVGALRRCVDIGDPAYADDAQFFLAKAWLRKGNREAATSALDVVSRSNGPRAPEARNLQKTLAGLNR